jgi:hypothetical protein
LRAILGEAFGAGASFVLAPCQAQSGLEFGVSRSTTRKPDVKCEELTASGPWLSGFASQF